MILDELAINITLSASLILKAITHQGIEPEIYFWRTSAGSEVDFVVAAEGKLVPIEVKLSATSRPAIAKSIRSFQEDFSDFAAPGYVVHPGGDRPPIAPGATALPFGEL